MSYFSRLTDIVTCNLTEILENSDDPEAAVKEIVFEMETGVAGARRSVTTAAGNEKRLRNEIAELQSQVTLWVDRAKDELSNGQDEDARLAIARKQEVEDLLAGLEQQHLAAISTHEHLVTTLRALEARLSDALRRQQLLAEGSADALAAESSAPSPANAPTDDSTSSPRVDDELDALRRELGQL